MSLPSPETIPVHQSLVEKVFFMQRIYQIKYQQKWTGSREWVRNETNVLAGGDAQIAVDKVRRQTLRQTYKDQDTGKVQKCTAFRLREVTVCAECG